MRGMAIEMVDWICDSFSSNEGNCLITATLISYEHTVRAWIHARDELFVTRPYSNARTSSAYTVGDICYNTVWSDISKQNKS